MKLFHKLLSVYVSLLLLVIISMILLCIYNKNHNTRQEKDYKEIKVEGVLRIITEYTPGGYYISGDTTDGFQYELIRAIADISGLEVHRQLETSLTKSFEALDRSECDVIARNIPVNTEIKANYAFTDPLVMNKQVLIQRTAEANNGIEPLRNQLHLDGKTIYVVKNSPVLLRLEHLADEIGDSIHVIEDLLYSSEQLAIMVAKGDIDYAVCDQQAAIIYKKELQEIDIETDISFTELQAWVVRKDAVELRDSLNSWFRQIRQSGVYDKIYQRYNNSW